MSEPSSTSTSLPSPSPSISSDTKPGLTSSGNLYLITFLATLFLLLVISCSIVLRSYAIRRRFQRQLDDALAAGIILAPRVQGSRKRRVGATPIISTSWIAQGGDKWNEMMPVSALPFQVKRRYKNGAASSPSKHDYHEHPQSSPTLPPEPNTIRRRLLCAMHWRDDIKPDVDIPPVLPPLEKPPRMRMDMLQVSVLITMPSPNRPTTPSLYKLTDEDEDEGEIPEMVFGVTRLPYKPNHIT